MISVQTWEEENEEIDRADEEEEELLDALYLKRIKSYLFMSRPLGALMECEAVDKTLLAREALERAAFGPCLWKKKLGR